MCVSVGMSDMSERHHVNISFDMSKLLLRDYSASFVSNKISLPLNTSKTQRRTHYPSFPQQKTEQKSYLQAVREFSLDTWTTEIRNW